MRSIFTATVFVGIGYLGLVGVDSIQLPPARVVDAVADTSQLANGTAPFADAAAQSAESHRLERETSTSVPPTPLPTTTSSPTTEPLPALTQSSGGVTTTAPTTTSVAVVTTPPPATSRQRGEAALALFSYDWQTGLPGWEISFHPGRKGVLGYTFVQENRIEIYVRDDMNDRLLAHVIAHELGHAVDVTKNTGDDRRRWQGLRGISDKPWWPGNGATDFSTGAGDFAESFAAWQVGDAAFRSNLGPAPTAEEVALMSELANR